MKLIKRLVKKKLLLSNYHKPLSVAPAGDSLVCNWSREIYPVKNNAIDFFTRYDKSPLQIPPPPMDFVKSVAESLGIQPVELQLAKVAEAIKDTTKTVQGDPELSSEIRELASRMALREPLWYTTVGARKRVDTYSVNTQVKISFISNFINGTLPSDKTVYRSMRIKNLGACTLSSKPREGFYLSYHWYDSNMKQVIKEGLRSALPRDLQPDEEITVPLQIKTPAEPGLYHLQICPVQEYVSWNEDQAILLQISVREDYTHLLSNARYVDVPFSFNEELDLAKSLLGDYFGMKMTSSIRQLLLEVGGGVYPVSLPLSESCADVISVDISYSMSQLGAIYWSQPHVRASEDHFAFLTADVSKTLPFRRSIFDGVVICAALHHFADPIRLLLNLQKYMKNDGILVIVREPCAPNPYDRQYLEDIEKGINEQQFELEEYSHIFECAGLEPIDVCVRSKCSLMAVLKKSSSRHGRWQLGALFRRILQNIVGRF